MMKVLVADDDAAILEVVDLILSHHGFKVKPIMKGKDILKQVESFKPDVILLDVNLSGHDGMEICKELKSDENPCKHIPVILFSAIHDLKSKHVECEADDFLPKPFDNDQLIKKIKKHAMKN
ncbi:response regulator [Ginsengibacter hankyongi]|uniref:Response regulator n=1 Tax=Ginsengibacter hankyongi TaxID=2607284 RepID=A0A5J5IFB4_9BACT|nr:response regulator [Ginsengibacter hankyongi]KAA9038562.1 response regulator [Ginsengibacter hankyongi]